MDDADLTRMMEMEFEQEISLDDMEDSARRDDTKRKADGKEEKIGKTCQLGNGG